MTQHADDAMRLRLIREAIEQCCNPEARAACQLNLEHELLRQPSKPIGPYCSYPRDTWDGTCTHPPGCADVVVELWREHKIRLGLEKAS